jgi:beta-barrel assembly-enhancing protease
MADHSSPRFKAQFTDGKTAALHQTELTCANQGLAIGTTDRQLIEEWAWADVKLAESLSADRPIRLLNRSLEGARLEIEDRSILALLENFAPNLRRDPVTGGGIQKFALIGGLFACFAFFVVYGVPRLAGPLAKSIPMEWEEEIGAGVIKTVAQFLGAKEGYCKAPDGAAALQRLTDRLARTVQTPYRFKVLVAKSKTVNAFAAPGGYVVILSGLIQKADTADEVAGVLAHEMGHVIKRHPTKSVIHAYGWSMLIAALTGVSGSSEGLISSLSLHLATAAYSRDNEAEADAIAVEMLAKAHISTDGLIDFFQKLKKEVNDGSDNALVEYLASHPGLQKRIDAIKAKAPANQGAAMSQLNWKALKEICD